MKKNCILRYMLLVIIWVILMVISNVTLKGQEIASYYPSYTRLPVEGGTVKITVNVKNAPSGFVLKLAAGGLIHNFLPNVLNYKLVGNVIEVNIGPSACHFRSVDDQLTFYTNAGFVNLSISQPPSQTYVGFIKNGGSYNNVTFVNSLQSVTVVEEAVSIPSEASTFQYFWEVKCLHEQVWRRISGAVNPNSLTFSVESSNVTMVRRGVVTSSGLRYSNVVYYIPVHFGVLQDIKLASSSNEILPGKMISIFPKISLGEGIHVYYRWVKKESGSNTWTIMEGYNGESLQLSGVKRDISIRRLASIGSQTWTSDIFDFTYVDISQIKIETDQNCVSHFMPFTLRLEQDIGTEASFEWQKKGVNTAEWSQILDGVGPVLRNYSGIKEDTYFRLLITLDGEIYYSNEILIHYNNIGGGRITCSAPIIKSGEAVSIHSELPGGTSLGNHYTWEKKNDGENWTTINGLTGGSCLISGITENTYFRRKIVMDSQEYYSNEIFVIISSEPCMMRRSYLDSTSRTMPSRVVTDVVYYDGACRDVQYVMVDGSPSVAGDIVMPVYQGLYNDKERDYLPYSKVNNHGSMVSDPFGKTNWNYLESGERAYAFKKIVYDGSALVRQKRITGMGKNWHTRNKGTVITYGTIGIGNVRLYRVEANGTLRQNGYYEKGALHRQTITDENDNIMEAFIDREGKTVLTVNVNEAERFETYSIYDMYGLLRYVLPPEASNRIGTIATRENQVIRDYAYYYEYDDLERMTLKQLPGCDPVYMVYDKRDRLVMSQDGKQRAENTNKWSYSLYDGQNRVIETGEVISTITTHASLQAAAARDNYLPSGTRIALQYTLYDNYTATPSVPVHPFVPTTGYSTTFNSKVSGLITSVRTRVLDVTPEKWLTLTTYYDDRSQLIQTVSDNMEGQVSCVNVKYDFRNNMIRQRESHSINISQTDVLEMENSFDDRGRLLCSRTQLNNGTPAIVNYSYDVVGRLISRTLGVTTESMTYNTRGWLTSRSSIPFKMKLRYENPETGVDSCWNGNISEWEWQHGENTALMYGFTYDDINRLKGSVQKQKRGASWESLVDNYIETGITYDRNGNIKTLQRTAGGTTVDNLFYNYTGNQLTELTERIRTSPAGDVFLAGSTAIGNYSYDKNGNMINDSRRALNLSYNVLNLLNEVKTASGEVKARYNYLADGTKLQVRDHGEANGFDYLGSLTYRKSSAGLQLESANFRDGVIRANVSNSGGIEVNYFLTDHLGSVRVIVDGNGVVKERNDYYPFGAKHVRGDYPQLADNRYKYNGKEDQVTGDLDYLDYGARMYSSGLGRWFTRDPMQESFISLSPYNYCLGNPMIFIDPSGALTTHYVDKDYNVILQTDDGSDDVVMVSKSRIGEFLADVAHYGGCGYINTSTWNNYWKDEFGLAARQLTMVELAVSNWYKSKNAKNEAIAAFLSHNDTHILYAAGYETWAHLQSPESWANGVLGAFGARQLFKNFARASAKIGGLLRTVEDVMVNPQLLRGQSLGSVRKLLGESKNWVNDVMRKSSKAEGWVLRERNSAGTDFTGRMIQYHPGTSRHFNGTPYWKVSDGVKVVRVPLNN